MAPPDPGDGKPGLGFSLDDFQIAAIEALEADRSVLVAAPTGAGKTVVAEHAVTMALASGTKLFYTTPIKALSNQKYSDLVRLHGPDRIGLLTGDNSVNGDAPIVVMTTEVLRNMIYAGSAALDGLRYVVLDEVHYLQDSYRGPVWEEIIVHLSHDVRLVCLSATVSNVGEFADWLTATHGPTTTVTESHRPVKLENHLIANDRQTHQIVMTPLLRGGKANPAGRRFDVDPRRRHGPRRRYSAPRRAEVVEFMSERDMVPAIYFIFSRGACDDAAKACLAAGIRLTDDDERERITAIVERHMAALDDDDLRVLGYDRWLAALEAGIGAHHAGLVPPFKEAVEECFTLGLVKVVFATETLALGINMPARTVVIEKLSKFTGEHHEMLTPGQYTQITGRAGRRGMDDHGNALVAWTPFVSFERVAQLASSRRFELTSSFKPTYNMAVSLVNRYEHDEALDMVGRSFAQFRADRVAEHHPGRSRRITRSLVGAFDRICAHLASRGYMDGWSLTDKGDVLAGIYHEADLLIAECLTDGLFDDLDPPSLAAMASMFTYEHRSPGDPGHPWYPTRKLAERVSAVEMKAQELAAYESSHKLSLTPVPDSGFVAAAFAWAHGEHFGELLEDEEISGGDFVRNIKQLIDLVRQIAIVAPDDATRRCAAEASEALLRDVVEASTRVDTTDVRNDADGPIA